MVKITNREAQRAIMALSELAGMDLRFDLALKIRKSMRELEAHLQDVEEERKKLVLKYAERDDAGKLVQPPLSPDGTIQYTIADRDAFSEEFNALMSVTFEATVDFTVAEFKTLGKVKPSILVNLGDLLLD